MEYYATMENDESLPYWLTLDADSLQFMGLPETTDIGVYDIKVTASDGFGSSSSSFQINVTNSAESWMSADNVDQELNFTEDIPIKLHAI